MYSTNVAWSQIIGARTSQQDHAAVVTWPNGFRLLLLADGMGGHAAGDVASQLVVDTFKQRFIQSQLEDMRERLIDALEYANIAIFHKVKAQPELSGMGTTLIALVYDGLSIQWLSVGDSPIWLVRKDELQRLNENHSMSEVLAEKVAAGQMSEEEARTSPIRSQLLEAVMGENIDRVDAPHHAIALCEGDCLLLASDGVETCPGETILALVQQHKDNTEMLTTALLNAVSAIERPKQDNATVIVMQVNKTDIEEPTTVQPETSDPVEEPSTVQ
ncbi:MULTISPECIES: PP2C family protein-serine/threonine phosphatase [Alteromonas]|jgi:serine/threonine protein phosphatase PrpC|uniref:PP2C family protein-serine/threonine phosphatase n=1 Tax=Alteromonas TaxID=226 RepID=UPI001930E07A|nr:MULTISPECIES: protein phosphatase 2C domain-containing protein [Alteromonas]|tara:strand:- start:2626 stop:3447 length:822 start_codon:yes stop_codon:yes gene_type:complete